MPIAIPRLHPFPFLFYFAAKCFDFDAKGFDLAPKCSDFVANGDLAFACSFLFLFLGEAEQPHENGKK